MDRRATWCVLCAIIGGLTIARAEEPSLKKSVLSPPRVEVVPRPAPKAVAQWNPQQFELKCRLIVVAPLGRELVVASPTLATINQRPATFLVGGEFPLSLNAEEIELVETGVRITLRILSAENGKARLDVTAEKIDRVLDEVAAEDSEFVVRSSRFRTVRIVDFGKKSQMNVLRDANGGKAVLLEVTVQEVEHEILGLTFPF